MTPATFEACTKSSHRRLAVLLKQLLDIGGISQRYVVKMGEAFTKLTTRHALCYRVLQVQKKHGVGFLIRVKIAGNTKEFFSIKKIMAATVIELNKSYL